MGLIIQFNTFQLKLSLFEMSKFELSDFKLSELKLTELKESYYCFRQTSLKKNLTQGSTNCNLRAKCDPKNLNLWVAKYFLAKT